ncbi:MAG: hypothetical protein AAGA66_01015 [Bacteroidota bacterium]
MKNLYLLAVLLYLSGVATAQQSSPEAAGHTAREAWATHQKLSKKYQRQQKKTLRKYRRIQDELREAPEEVEAAMQQKKSEDTLNIVQKARPHFDDMGIQSAGLSPPTDRLEGNLEDYPSVEELQPLQEAGAVPTDWSHEKLQALPQDLPEIDVPDGLNPLDENLSPDQYPAQLPERNDPPISGKSEVLQKLNALESLQNPESLQHVGDLNDLPDLLGSDATGQYPTEWQELAGSYQKEWQQAQQLSEQYQNKFPDNMSDPQALSEEVKAYLLQHHEQLLAAQEQLANLKQTYRTIPGIHNMDSAIKRKSLQDEPTKKRLIVGGRLDVASYEPFTIDFAPRLGYQLDKKLSIGLQGSYRKTLGKNEALIFLSESVQYAAFVDYGLVRSFFAYSEAGQAQVAEINPTMDPTKTAWTSTWLAGIGKDFHLTEKLKTRTMLLYNFLHEPERPVYPNKWVVKFGLQWDWITP